MILSTLKRNDHLTFRGNVNQGRHGWLRLTPAYSLHVVQRLLETCTKDDSVLDPFSGTGTTPLAAACLGIPSCSVDINPFLVWFGNVKLTVFSPQSGHDLIVAAEEVIDEVCRNIGNKFWVPDLHQIEKWWNPKTLASLSAIHAEISKRKQSNIKNLLKVAFCRLMIQEANVSFGHQSMSFKSKPSSLFDRMNEATTELASFMDSVLFVRQGLENEFPLAESAVFEGDSRNLESMLPKKDFSVVITSPPYPNRMSYVRELRPYMYWLGYLNNGRQAGELDWQAIGGTWGCATSFLNQWTPPESVSIPFPEFDRIRREIEKNNPILARYVHRYFIDTLFHIRSLKKVLRNGARCHYIVGNSKFFDTVLPVEKIYASFFQSEGFGDVNIDAIRKRNSKKELFEYIVTANHRQ